MLHPKKRWRLTGENMETTEALMQQLGIESLTARLIDSTTSLRSTLNQQDLSDDWMMVDTVCNLAELSMKSIEEYQRHCQANHSDSEPKLLLLGVELTDFRAIGDRHQHLKLTIKQDESVMECIGYDMGNLLQEMTPYSKANLVAEPIIREWNGIRRIQLLLLDMEIPEMQIFDFREMKDKSTKLLAIAHRESLILCFRKESIADLVDLNVEAGIYFVGEEPSYSVIRSTAEMYMSVIIYDTPYCLEQFNYGLSLIPKPECIYCLFGSEYTDRLAVMPGRDQFKWLYAVFMKLSRIPYTGLTQLAKSRNLSEQSIQFMVDVFQELGFIYEEDRMYHIVAAPIHKDLHESVRFRRKKTEIELETEILYSSYGILCKIIKQVTL
ncbi:MAG TPA: single-stranded-DNA-specific exonuclease C-terminal domain-containing protein [Bacillota bacterium]|nr:single-stranded-DNA-specific exonuclease C-terminal domain-containing protein [Bacillota bacterium]